MGAFFSAIDHDQIDFVWLLGDKHSTCSATHPGNQYDGQMWDFYALKQTIKSQKLHVFKCTTYTSLIKMDKLMIDEIKQAKHIVFSVYKI